MTLIFPTTPADADALAMAEAAMQQTQDNLDAIIEEMVTQPHHVLLFEEGMEDLAHLTLQGVARTLVDEQAPTNPTLDNFVILDTHEDGWADVSPILDVTPLSKVTPGSIHHSQTIFAFGTAFLRSNVVKPVAARAQRFYAAIPRTSLSTDLIERIHPMEEAVLL